LTCFRLIDNRRGTIGEFRRRAARNQHSADLMLLRMHSGRDEKRQDTQRQQSRYQFHERITPLGPTTMTLLVCPNPSST
jgi:hypothetical protein